MPESVGIQMTRAPSRIAALSAGGEQRGCHDRCDRQQEEFSMQQIGHAQPRQSLDGFVAADEFPHEIVRGIGSCGSRFRGSSGFSRAKQKAPPQPPRSCESACPMLISYSIRKQ